MSPDSGIHIFGGGTISHIRAHFAITAAAYGQTARDLETIFKQNGITPIMHMTKMASMGQSDLETNEDIRRRTKDILCDPSTRVIIFNAAIVDFNGTIGDVASDKYATRLHSRDSPLPSVTLSAADKIIPMIKQQRPDIFLIAFKTTTNAQPEEQAERAQKLINDTGADLVLANDTKTRRNILMDAQGKVICDTTERHQALEMIAQIARQTTAPSKTSENARVSTVPKVFIDGQNGTTGLMIHRLLQPLVDAKKIDVISINNHRNDAERRAAYEAADLTVLCLPDEAARDAIQLMHGTKTRVLDASSAHRTSDGWIYGLPELNAAQSEIIKTAQHVSNPGCFATGAIILLRPLIEAGMLDRDECITLFGTAGYTAGGKKAIDRHAHAAEKHLYSASALNTPHKHIAEIQKYCGLDKAPLFAPHVVDTPRGLMISAIFNRAAFKGSFEEIKNTYKKAYADSSVIHVVEEKVGHIDLGRYANSHPLDVPQPDMHIYINGWDGDKENDGTIRITAVFDNLGKGASTQAVQNIKLMLGL